MECQTWDKACQVNDLLHKGIAAIGSSLDGFSSLTLRKTNRGRSDTVSCLRRCHGFRLVKYSLLRVNLAFQLYDLRQNSSTCRTSVSKRFLNTTCCLARSRYISTLLVVWRDPGAFLHQNQQLQVLLTIANPIDAVVYIEATRSVACKT